MTSKESGAEKQNGGSTLLKNLIEKSISLMREGTPFVMATITFKHGSMPREVGATMLVTEAGRCAGTIGGGQQELEVTRHARELVRTEKSDLVYYETTPAEAARAGMVCGSHNKIHYQYIAPDDKKAAAYFQMMLDNVEKHEVYWLFSLGEDHGISVSIDGGREPFSLDGSEPPEEELFKVKIKKPMRVFIFGGGHVAKATAALLHFLQLDVTVVDDRPEYLTPEEFPGVKRELKTPDQFGDVHIENSDYVCIMTRGHQYDIKVLEYVLPLDPYYIGIVGNKMKAASYPKHFTGTPLEPIYAAKVHIPVGIPIKALTPEEIAVSIAGEIILSYRSNV